MKIEASSLTNCTVVKGGDSISLGMIDGNGHPLELKVSASDACGLAMTLPKLLKISLNEKYHDPTLRYVFPLDGWKVETASDGQSIIVTLTTGHGFEVSFGAKPEMCRSLSSALNDSTDQRAALGASLVS